MGLASLSQILVKKTSLLKDRIISNLIININEIKNKCPKDTNSLNKIITNRNQIVDSLTSLKQVIKTLNSVIDPLDNIIPPINVAINLLKILPIPSSVPPGVGIPMGVILSAGDGLSSIQSILKQTEKQIDSFDIVLDYMVSSSDTILNQIKLLDFLINKCKKETPNNIGLINDLNKIDSEFLSQLEEIKKLKQNILDLYYKGFIFEIIEENSNLSIKRKFAVAKNSQGIILLKTNPSFTSSPEILIEELKFNIDKNNLIAF